VRALPFAVSVDGRGEASVDSQVGAVDRSAERAGDEGDQAGLSRATFTRRFTALVGEPPLTYLTRWRLTTAARMLRQQDVPLSAVAHRVGYTSEFAFAKTFKREYRLAPGTDRRLTRIEEARPA
jgi:transcriptional regulator GlxA family with amidase domain